MREFGVEIANRVLKTVSLNTILDLTDKDDLSLAFAIVVSSFIHRADEAGIDFSQVIDAAWRGYLQDLKEDDE